MNTIDKPATKSKYRKSRFFFGMIKPCTIIFAIYVFLILPIQVTNAQSIKVLIKGTEPLPMQNEPVASQEQRKNIIIKQPGNTDLSSINDSEDWMLMLVNGENPLPDNYFPKLKKLKNGLEFDERAIDQLNAMLSDATAQGLSPIVCSAYRAIEKQRTLFNNYAYGLIDGRSSAGNS